MKQPSNLDHPDFEQSLDPNPHSPTPARRQLSDLHSCFSELTLNQRISALLVFSILGYILQIGSFSQFISAILQRDPMHFSLIYSLGNVLALIGLFFLVGVQDQLNMITHQNRRTVSIVYFGSMALCLVLPFVMQNAVGRVLVGVLVVVQMGAYWWYTLSYLPWARECVRGCFNCVRKMY